MVDVSTERLKIIPLDKQSLELSIIDFNKMEKSLGLIYTDENIGQIEKDVFRIRLVDVKSNEENYMWFTTWMVILKSENRIIGHIMIKGYPDKNGDVTIGYYTQPLYRGNGYMSEAVIGIIEWIFLNSDVKSVIADTLKSNIISQSLLKKVGMRFYKEDDECFWWKLENKEINIKMNEEEIIINGLNSETMASDELIELMLKNIGSPSPKLRDNIIYIGWVNLVESNKISIKQKLWLINKISAKNLLFYGIEEECSDKVFTRSFVSLLLVVLLESHFKNSYIDTETEKEIIKLSIEYMETEKDNRGLVDEKGWAHAFAHGADLLETISKSIYLTSDNVTRVLNCISRALIDIENFLFGEESRIAKVIISLIKFNKLNQSRLNSWVKSNNETLMESTSFNLCWVKFLMSLSYMLKFENIEFKETQILIAEYLKFFYLTFEII